MSKLRIAYFGDGPWSHRTLAKLAERKDDFEIVFVTPRFDKQDSELCRLAKEYNLDVKLFEDVNKAEALKFIRSCNLDIVVSMSFNQIMRKPFLDIPRIGSLNCHAGALPRYRGRNVLNWALINGETKFGVTAHFIDTGIDTGDIIHQEIIPIGKDDRYAEILELAYDACPRVLIAALDKLLDGSAEPQSQIELGKGFYCGQRRLGDEWIDWSWSAERIVNFVRAISHPGPGAFTALDNQVIVVQRASLNAEHPTYIGTEGEVVGKDELGVWVKASDTVVRIERCQYIRGPEEFRPGWRIGTRLANKQDYRLSLLECRGDLK